MAKIETLYIIILSKFEGYRSEMLYTLFVLCLKCLHIIGRSAEIFDEIYMIYNIASSYLNKG